MKTPLRTRLFAWVFGTLLFLLPGATRIRYGPEMKTAFRKRLSEGGGGFDSWVLGLRMMGDLLVTLPLEWMDRLKGVRRPGLRSSSPYSRDPGTAWAGMEFLRQDLRIGIRYFLRQPGFSLVALSMIALGIGATTSIFSVVDGVLVRPLPYPRPSELVYFKHGDHPPPRYRAWEDGARSFSSLAAARGRGFDMVGEGDPERLRGALVTPGFFPMFGGVPGLGRLFASSDFAGSPRVVVLSHGFWERGFGADRGVIGNTITLSDGPMEVVGVLPPGFLPPGVLVDPDTDVWLPLDLTLPEYQDPEDYILTVAGRLRTDLSLEVAQADLEALAETLAEENPEVHRARDGSPRPIVIGSLAGETVREVSQGLVLLFGSVLLMLLIACANVANLFLARGTARGRELAVRAALGARTRWIIRQLLTESVLLSLAGGVMGVALSFAGVRAFHSLVPGDFPLGERIQVDLRVMAFSLMACLLTGVLFGMAPAWQAWRMDVAKKLKDSTGGSIGGFRRVRLRNGLLVGQICISLVLVVGAGLLFKAFIRLNAADPGFDADGLAAVPLFLDEERYSEEMRATLAEDLTRSLERVPGVLQAAFSVTYPFEYYGGATCCWFNSGFRTDTGVEPGEISAVITPVSNGYFHLLQARIRGREFIPGDEDRETVPVVLSETLANRLFPEGEALGREYSTGNTVFSIVGVVSGLHHWGLTRDPLREVYIPWASGGQYFDDLKLLVRTEGDPGAMAHQIRTAIWAVDSDLPVPQILPLRSRMGQSLAQPRLLSTLLLLFATLATVLAAGGIYGSVLYQVRQRTREMGLRLALGAGRRRILGLVVGGATQLSLLGVLLGLGGVWALRRTLESVVYGISGTHLPTLLGAALLVGTVSMGASYAAARRALVTDLASVLRGD